MESTNDNRTGAQPENPAVERRLREVIEDFFSSASLPHYKKYLSTMIRAAVSQEFWDLNDPSALLEFKQKLGRIVKAAFFYTQNKKLESTLTMPSNPSPALLNDPCIDPSWYAGWHRNLSSWDYFPRYLNKHEFLNPRLVFYRFFKSKGVRLWRQEIEDLVFYALSSYSCLDDHLTMDFLEVNKLLHKLMEAAHLIEVREIKPGIPGTRASYDPDGGRSGADGVAEPVPCFGKNSGKVHREKNRIPSGKMAEIIHSGRAFLPGTQNITFSLRKWDGCSN
jgi:hypothetical protein